MKKEFKGELQWISPDKIIKEEEKDDVGSFFVSLGLVFNDLKSIILLGDIIITDYRRLEESECSVHAGNIGGIIVYVNKTLAGIIHEFFILLEKNKDILNSEEFQGIVSKLPSKEKYVWNGMIRVANNQLDSMSDFTKTLLKIRNNFGFHYYQSGKSLKRGFKSRFYNEDIDDRNERAYYSIGKTINETRFYFVDAAIEESLSIAAGKADKKKFKGDPSMEEYYSKVNATIMVMAGVLISLLKKFLKERQNTS
jgi:hypothetical protein